MKTGGIFIVGTLKEYRRRGVVIEYEYQAR